MMIIIAVTFLGLLGHTFAVEVTTIPAECLKSNGEIKSGFEANRFFTGDWYLTHARDPENPPRCEKYKARSDLHLTFNGKSGSNVECQGTEVSAGFYSFQCTTSGLSFTSFMAVLETDYNNYALLYRCGRYGSNLLDNFLLFNRQSSGGIPTELNTKLTALDLATSLKKLGCS